MGLCPFCREPDLSSDEEDIKRVKKLMESGNAHAFNNLGGYYARGVKGMPQDYEKANELRLRAGVLGCPEGYYNLGNSYHNGRGVTVDEKKLLQKLLKKHPSLKSRLLRRLIEWKNRRKKTELLRKK